MSCQRAQEIDLMAFAADRRSSEWAEFREHYPQCPECSRAVARVASLEAALTAPSAGAGTSGSAHLDEAALLAWVDGDLTPAQRPPLEAHLAGCASCRTALAVLQTFELDPELSPATSVTDSRESTEGRGGFSGFREALGRLLQPAPGFAVAIVVAVGVWVLWSMAQPDPETAPPRFAEEPASQDPRPKEAPRPGDSEPSLIEEDRSLLAEDSPRETPPADDSLAPIVPTPPNEMPPPKSPLPLPEQLAETPATPTPEAIPDPMETLDPPSDSDSPGEREVVLLAALLPSEMPRYATPAGFSPFDLEDVRIAGTVRAAQAEVPRLSVLAPSHTGATAKAAPRLYWALDRRSVYPVEVIVNDPASREALLVKRIPAPVAAGLHVLDLASEGLSLAEGRTLEWSIALQPNTEGGEVDVVSLAAVKRLPAIDAEEATPEARAALVHRFAAAGYWYDAYDELNAFLRASPGTKRLLDYRRSLLQQVGLESVEGWLGGVGEKRGE